MPRLHDSAARWFCGWALILGLCAAAAPLPPEWRRVQSFDVPAAGLLKISLPVETLDAGRAGLEDLRLYDGAGQEIPYLIERPAPGAGMAQAAKSFRLALNPDNTVITIETGLAQPLDAVTLESPADDFIKAVRVESSEDGEGWQLLAQGQPIFRQPNGASRMQISWLPAVAKWLRLTVNDRRSQPVPFTGAGVHAAKAEPVPGEWMAARIAERDENPGESRLALNLGAANLSVASLRLETAEPLFMRPISVAVARMAEDSIREQTIGQGAVYRIAVEGQPGAENLSIPLETQACSRELVLFIKNGDNPPLPVSTVSVERRPVYLVFLAREPGIFHLLTGNGHCGAPRYDLAALGMNLKSVPVSPIKIPAPLDNPDYRAPEVLPGLEAAGAPLDVSGWRFRQPLRISGAGAQELELDLDALAHAKADLADLRVMSGGNQVPYIIERTSIRRSLTPAVRATNDVKHPKLSRWIIQLPRANLPIERLACAAKTPLFQRAMSLSEDLSDERGEKYRRELGGALWTQTPERKGKEFALSLNGPAQGDSLLLETENGDNPPIALEKFALFYPATRVLFEAKAGDELFLYYGNPGVPPPNYDLSLVAEQLLAAERKTASLAGEQQLRKTSWGESHAASQGGLVFWAVLALVVIVLLIIISRLLPQSRLGSGGG
jgi:hypothetical protein